MKRFRGMVLAGIVLSMLAVNFCSAKDRKVGEDTTETQEQEMDSGTKEEAAVKGTVKLPVFMVDFPDNRFQEGVLPSDKLKTLLFSENQNSMTTRAKDISDSQLHLDGDIFYYTAKYDMEKYENSNDPTEELAREVLSAFDSQIDYMDYDSNDDKYVDVFVLSVAGEDTCWQETNGIWKENSGFQLDGMKFGRYIVNDAQPYTENEDGFVEKINYEFDLCMGLTDYYKR